MAFNKVLIISYTDIHEATGAAYARYYNYALALRSSGIDVIFVSFLNSFTLRSKAVTDNNGIQFYGSRRSSWGLIRKLKRKMMFLVQFYLNAVIIIKGLHKDAVILWSPKDLFSDVMACFIYRTCLGKRIVCEKNERVLGIHKNNIFRKYGGLVDIIINGYLYVISALQDESIGLYSHIIAISYNMYRWSKKRNSNVTHIPIIVNSNLAYSSIRSVGEILKFSYFGTINNSKEGIFDFLTILHLFDNSEQFTFDLYGFINDSDQQKLQNRSRMFQNAITYRGVLSNAEAVIKMRDYDVLVLPRPRNIQCNFGSSTKLGEYMLSGRAILVSNISDNRLYIRNKDNGFIYDADDKESLTKSIRNIFDMRDLLPQIGSRGLQTALDNFSLETNSALIKSAIMGNR